MFAPASGANKRLRIEEIHRGAKKQHPTWKKICMGGGRVSGRSRENLINELLPRVDIVQQKPAEAIPESAARRELRQNSDYDLYETSSRPRHLPPSLAARPTTIGPLTQVQEVRRYSEIHAEMEAASTQLHATIAVPGAQLLATNEVASPPSVAQEIASPPPFAAQEVAPVPPTPLPPTKTQSVSSMLQTFAFEDTRDGYDNDPNSLF